MLTMNEATDMGHMHTTVDFTAPDGSVTTCCACAKCQGIIEMFNMVEELCATKEETVKCMLVEGKVEDLPPRTVLDTLLASSWNSFIADGVDMAALFFRHGLKWRTHTWGDTEFPTVTAMVEASVLSKPTAGQVC